MTLFYPLINFFCFIIQGIVLIKKYFSSFRSTEDKLFIDVIVVIMTFTFCDGLFGLESIGILPQSQKLTYLLNTIYFCLSAVMVYFWAQYAQYVMKSDVKSKHQFFYYLSYLPLLVVFFLSATTYWTGKIFYVEGTVGYHRGPLFALQQIVSYYYLFVESLVAIIKAKKPENYPERSVYLTIASFPIFPTLSIPLYLFIPDCPGLIMGLTVSCVQAIVFGLSYEISTDNLTGVYNRNSLNKQIRRHIGNKRSYGNVYLLLIDINDFHAINEKSGREGGDKALKLSSNAIIKATDGYHAFVARLSGDDFGVLVETRNPLYIDRLIESLSKEFAKANSDNDLPYELSFSLGYAALNKEHTRLVSFINDAQRKLFEAKINRG